MSWVLDVCAVMFVMLYGFNTLMRLTKFIPQEVPPMDESVKRMYN